MWSPDLTEREKREESRLLRLLIHQDIQISTRVKCSVLSQRYHPDIGTCPSVLSDTYGVEFLGDHHSLDASRRQPRSTSPV